MSDIAPLPTQDNVATLICKRCGARGADGRISIFAGRFPRCIGCGGWLVYAGKTPSGPCITPNGRIDGHGAYVRSRRVKGKLVFVCAFCDKTV